ncbi:hypothetical protein O1W68_02805 [Rhodococcus sp. H36-A4]|uniref:hypothetical protein n=1 Tax=Rhodococcus sp. H36-A4 TaxID=3004353 RepID=UPI0022AEE283|nr:hypothetical protein [Rhodococcus sp. H36-A4]MCZ4076861.1 hypothetical protein [Rhodococcus sp. H36-A4]
MHLNGQAPVHLLVRVREELPERELAREPVSTVELDSGYYEHGTRARRDAHDLLGGVDSALADVEARADKLLQDLFEVLESETDEGSIDGVE